MLLKIRQTIAKFEHAMSLAVFELLLGLFMLINPSVMALVILCVLGVLFLGDGLVRCISYFRETPEEAKKEHKLASGLFFLIVGLFFLFNYRFVVNIFPVVAVLYGIFAMALVFLKTEWLVNSLREKSTIWYVVALSLVFSFIAMLVLYTSRLPFIGSGILLVLSAVLDAVYYFDQKGKISLPSFSTLIHNIRNGFKQSSQKAAEVKTETAAAHTDGEVKESFYAQSHPVEDDGKAENTTPPSEPSFESAADHPAQPVEDTQPAEESEDTAVDPADEDMSWANVPQLEMPQ